MDDIKIERTTAEQHLYSELYLSKLMKSQFNLSIRLFTVFLCILLGLPVLNYVFPEIMNIRIFGFTLTWFILGVIIYPITWVISWVYVKKSIALEKEAAAWISQDEQ